MKSKFPDQRVEQIHNTRHQNTTVPTSKREKAASENTNIGQSVAKLNQATILKGENIRFSLDEKLNQMVVKIVDIESNEVIRQFPAEHMIALHKKMLSVIENRQNEDLKKELQTALDIKA